KVVTAHPQVTVPGNVSPIELDQSKIHFFYPAFPRMFKNLEAIGEAVKSLSADVANQIKVHFTLDGTENGYARFIRDKYGDLPQIEFDGLLATERVRSYYLTCDALLFPTRLETWGLPQTEFSTTQKPIFA